MEEKKVYPELVMVMSVLAASTGAIFIRFAQTEVPSLVIAAYRLGLATLILAFPALVRYRKEIRGISRRDIFLVLGSGIFLALHFASWITSLEYTSVASSAVLVSMSPLIVALLSTLLLHEPLSKSAWIGLLVALTGSMVVGFSDYVVFDSGKLLFFSSGSAPEGNMLLGNLLAFGGAVFVAGYLIIGRSLRKKMALVPYTFLVFGTAAVCLFFASLIAGHSLGGYPTQSYVWLAALAVIPQILGHASFNWALGYLSATFVSTALLGEPIGSTILAYFLLKEPPGFLEIAGGLLILIGIYLASKKKA